MSRSFLLLFVVFLLFGACGQAPQTQSKETAQTNEFFGDKISADQAVSYEDLLQKMESSDSLNVKVTGQVSAVCQKKGCWMNIVSDQEGQPEMFVKFKDYGFFMPLNITGRKVIMDGYAFRSITSVDELRHYAEDDGKSKAEIEAITEPLEELKFMASGVILLPEES